MSNRIRLALLMVIAAALAAGLGYYAGQRAGQAAAEREALDGAGREPGSIGRTSTGVDPAKSDGPAGDVDAAPAPFTMRGMESTVVVRGDGQVEVNGMTLRDVLASPVPLERWKGMIAYAEGLDEGSIDAAIAQLEELPEEVDTIIASFFFYSQYGDKNPAAKLEAMGVDDSGWSKDQMGRESIYAAWSGDDPVAAAAHLVAMESADDEEGQSIFDGSGDGIARSIAANWVRTDPKGAFDWVMSLHASDRRQAQDAVLAHWVAKDPAAAAAAVLHANVDEKRGDLFESVAKNWAKTDYRSALGWAQSLPEGERTAAIRSAVSEWAREDPLGAAQRVDGMTSSEERERAVMAVAGNWATADAPAAANWVLQQADVADGTQFTSMNSILNQWAKDDALAASEWLSAQPPGQLRDGGVAGMATRVVRDDPEGALLWTLTISNEKQRLSYLERLTKQWAREDKDAAAAWIAAEPSYPEELRKKFLPEPE